MKKKQAPKSSVPKVDPYLEGLMAKLLDRLVSLEHKMDTVISQTSHKSSGNSDRPANSQNTDHLNKPKRDRVLYEAICADCHKVCEVPFRPSEDRAVYCKECFGRRKSGGAAKPSFPVLTPVALPSRPSPKPFTPSSPASSAVAVAPPPSTKSKKSAGKTSKKTKRK